MKSLNKLFIILAAVGLSFTACDNNNSSGEDDTDIPAVEANTQGTSNGNQVTISNVVSPENGWIVIHRSNAEGNGPQVPEIIGKSMIEAGCK